MGHNKPPKPAEAGGASVNPNDPILQILQSYGGRQGVGFSIQRLSEIASLGLDKAQASYGQIDPLLTGLFDRARGDVAGSFQGERQRVADSQSATQARLSQQLGQSGLGSLRASLSSGLEQQGLRQNQNISDTQSRSLAELGAREGTLRSQGLQALGGFLERRSDVERLLAEMKTQHIVARKTGEAEGANASSVAGGAVSGAAAGSAFGPWGAVAGGVLGGGIAAFS